MQAKESFGGRDEKRIFPAPSIVAIMSPFGSLPLYPISEPGPDKDRLAKLSVAADEGIAAVADSLVQAIAERLYAGDMELAEPQRLLRNRINNTVKKANRQLSSVSDGVATAIAERAAAGDTMLRSLPEGLPTGLPPIPGTIYQPPQKPPPIAHPPPIVQGPPIGPPTVPQMAWNLWKSSVSTPPPCYCLSSYSPPLHPDDTNVAQYRTFQECNDALGRFCDAMNVPRPPPIPQQPPAAPIQNIPQPQQPQPIQGIPQAPQQIATFPQPTIDIGPQQQQQQGGLVVSPYPGSFSSFPGLPQGWVVVGVQCGGGGQVIYGSGPGLAAMLGGGNCSAVWGPPTFNPDIITPTPQQPTPPFPIQNVPIGVPPTPPTIIHPTPIPISPPPPTPCPPPPPCPPQPPCPPCPTRPTLADCQVCGKCENGKLTGVDSKVALIPWGIRVGSSACLSSDCGIMELKEAVAANLSIAGYLSALSQEKWHEAMDELYSERGAANVSDTKYNGQESFAQILIPVK